MPRHHRLATSAPRKGSSRALLAAAAVMLGVATATAPAPLRAGDTSQMPATVAAPADSPERWSILDGKVFQGEFGATGEDEPLGQDSWVFEEGMFVSEKCVECGFPESPYWVSFHQRGTVFTARTQCPETDAIITWQGTVENDRIEGTYTWVRERWYWTVERSYWFHGTLKKMGHDGAVSLE